MNNSKLAKQEAQLKKLNAQIKEAKIKIDKNLGHKLIAKLNLDYADLDKDTINHLINQLAHLYQASECHE